MKTVERLYDIVRAGRKYDVQLHYVHVSDEILRVEKHQPGGLTGINVITYDVSFTENENHIDLIKTSFSKNGDVKEETAKDISKTQLMRAINELY